jgi:hypothetical protein
MMILHLAALLVPRSERPEWSREWESELWYVRRNRLMFCLGAFRDALWVRRNSPGERHAFLQSPRRCLSLLAFLAALTIPWIFYLPEPPGFRSSDAIFTFVFELGVALLVLRVLTPISLGEYPVTAGSTNRWVRSRRWIFLAAKVALVLLIVFCGTVALTQIAGAIVAQPQAAMVAYFFAFRWVLKDQRRRCPVCLQLLTNPVRIGRSSRFLLDWNGTELMCEQGHGLLYVPETPSTFSGQRWLYLDPSWRSLFLRG